MYFRLQPDCHLVEGTRGGALYDVGRQRLLILDESMYALTVQCVESISIQDLPPQAASVATNLCEHGYGEFTSVAVFSDKLWFHKKPSVMAEPKQLRRIDLAITDECDLSCSFCPRKASDKSVRACFTCLRRSPLTERRGSAIKGTTIAEQLHESGGGILHIRGGDPLLAMEKLKGILDAAEARPNVQVFVTTPLSVTEIDAALAVASRATINLVMVPVEENSENSQRCEEAGNCKMELADRLTKAGRRFTITIIGVDTLEERRAKRRMAYARWGKYPTFAEVPSTRVSLGLMVPSTLAAFSFGEGSFRCLDGRCEVGTDGRAYLCAGVDADFGSIASDEPLLSIRKSKLDTYWSLSKNDMKPCSTCSLRPACVTCAGSAEFSGSKEGRYECKASNIGEVLPRPYSKRVWIGEMNTNQEPRIRQA